MERGYVIQAREQTRAGRTEIHLFGKLEAGETFAVVERRWRPFFYVRTEEQERTRSLVTIEGPEADILLSDRFSMDGDSMARVETPSVSALQRLNFPHNFLWSGECMGPFASMGHGVKEDALHGFTRTRHFPHAPETPRFPCFL